MKCASRSTPRDYVSHRNASSTQIYAKIVVERLLTVALGDGEEVL
jgi:integrase/recombinase XerD